ncbi:MAG TPA: hypothetical protein PKE32_00995 [Miltoncostaeaceae bacterium]|nr:hypothetical protein [Miltoncostaeaceae bacterium]
MAFGQLGPGAEQGDIDVVRAVRPGAVVIARSVGEGQAQRRNRVPGRRPADVGIAGQAPDQHHTIDVGSHRSSQVSISTASIVVEGALPNQTLA